MSGGVDGVVAKPEHSAVGISLDTKPVPDKKWYQCTFDPFTFFGLITYLVVLYGVYAGFFTALYEIALAVRGTDYFELAGRLDGHTPAPGSYTMPWDVLPGIISPP